MTAPRQILPGTTYLVTRRCSQRQFLLRPSSVTNETYGFILAVAAKRFGIEIHAFCVMSNHALLVLTDPEARLPAFSRYLDSLVARALNPTLRRRENFWAPSSYSAVALQGPSDVVDKVAYLLANPVAAGLVRRGRMWPGLWSEPAQMGAGALEFKRPAHFFRKKGAKALPERASLELAVPQGIGTREQFRRAVSDSLQEREEEAAAGLAADGRGFLGVRRVLVQRPTGDPPRPEPRRGLNPRVACRDTGRRIEALGRLVEFLRDHRQAFVQWRAGARCVVFPAGTYLMRVLHGASCAAPG
jgi:REP element-mobilizing transposase RayT